MPMHHTAASANGPSRAGRPLLVTMGDASGIGPEIVAKAAAAGELADAVVVGDVDVLRRAVAACGLMLPVAALEHPCDLAACPPAALAVCTPAGLEPGLAALPYGAIDARAGAAAARCIEQAVAWMHEGAGRAIVTAPIHKEALSAAGVPFPGHTEMLQALSVDSGEPPPVRMMLANDELRVVLVTIHMSLRRAIDALSTQGIVDTLAITHAAGLRFGLATPRIAVAGLNPHAGEGGYLGREEIDTITPALDAARARGIDALGPYPADTLFQPKYLRDADCVLAMYHDQGLPVLKFATFGHGINITLGLPLIRTSVDHGTALDLAAQGLGKADCGSMEQAINAALAMANNSLDNKK